MRDTVEKLVRMLVPVAVTAVCAAHARAQQPQRYTESVKVSRVIVDAHVVDSGGAPIAGLTGDDFLVRIDGQRARVEHVRWVASGEGAEQAPPGGQKPAKDALPAAPLPEWTETSGRLLVLVFQRSMEPSRLGGLMLMQARAERFIQTLGPYDRVALVWFDSHLKLAADFTTDRARLAELLRRSVVWATPEPLAAGDFPSLAARFDYAAAARAGSIEQGLEVLARALEQLQGPKSVVLFGWGLGRFSGGYVWLDDDYERARRALVAARTSVFSLDVTAADAHSLEVGLQTLSEETGGYYVRTFQFEEASFQRIANMLAGHYELLVEKPERPPGTHTIEVSLTRRHGTVLARKAYTD